MNDILVLSFEPLSSFENGEIAYESILLSDLEEQNVTMTRIESLGEIEKPPDHIVGVLSAVDVSSFVVEVPEKQRKYLSKTMPYLLEDDLILPLDAQHIPYIISSDNCVRAIVIHQKLMDQLMTLLEGAGIQLNELYVDADLLTDRDDQQNVIDKGEKLVVRGDQLITYVDDGVAVEQIAVSCSVEKLVVKPITISAQMISNPPSSAINLLQGKYVPIAKGYARAQLINSASITVTLLLLLQIGYWFVLGLIYSHRSEIIFAESETDYLSVFPHDIIVDVRSQAEGHLLSLGDKNNGEGLLNVLARLGQTLTEMDAANSRVQSIRHDSKNGQTNIDLSFATIEEVEEMVEQLQLQLAGYNVQLLQISRETSASVSARLRVTGL